MFAVKKRNIIICLILACLLCIAGLFFVGKDKNADVTARADATDATTENASLIYFEGGASIETGNLDFARMRFIVHVHKDFFSGGHELLLGLSTDTFKAGVLLMEQSGAESYDGQHLKFGISGLDFSGNNWVEVRVVVNVCGLIYQDVQLSAYRLDNVYNSTLYARSPLRNWHFIYTSLLANGTIENNNLADSIIQFKETAAGLEISENAGLSSYSGLTLLVNIPNGAWENIGKGTHVVSEQKTETSVYGNSYSYISSQRKVRYFLSVFKSSGKPNLADKTYRPELEVKKIDGRLGFNVGYLRLSHTWNSGYYYLGLVKEITDFTQTTTSISSQKTTTAYVVDEWSNAVYIDVPALAIDILSTDNINLTENESLWLQDVAGVRPSTSKVTVWLKYKKLMQADDLSSIGSPIESFEIPSAYAYSKQLAIEYMYKLKDFSGMADFNVVYSGAYWENGFAYKTGKRIVLQAEDFNYAYSSDMQSGTLEVRYADFQYKDLSIKIKNNDKSNPLVMDVYTDNVTVGATETTLVYKYSDVQTWLLNSCQWLFELTEDNIVVNNLSDNITVKKEVDKLTVSFPNDKQGELLGASLQAVAEITEDTECSVSYRYSKLSLNNKGDIVEEKVTSDPFSLFYSELVGKYSTFENFMLDYGEEIRGAVVVPGLDGEYFIPSGLYLDRDDTGAYTFVVEYTYNTIFKITDNISQDVRYRAMNKTNLYYNGNYFVDDIPSGYHVLKITSTSNRLDIENKENYSNSEIVVKTSINQKLILPIHIEFTDKWNIVIDYKETYKDTCFAVKKQQNSEIRVLDYSDIYSLTVDDIQRILGKNTLDVCGMVSPDEKVDVSFNRDNFSYTATLTYGVASLKQIDYDGNSLEIQVPLTSYVDWCNQYGANWSILFLNTENKRYFARSNEVNREDLYGFFSVAVFKEQISDFNYYFKNNTGAGCMTIFNKKEVVGSSIYKWFGGLTGKGVLTSVLGYVGMAFCEVANDNNQILHSYFFYLDGSDPNAYLSNGGADNAFDTDSSTGNFIEDVGETFGEWMSDLKSAWDESPVRKLLAICSFILIGSTTVFVIIWLKRKFKIKKKARTSKKKSAPANKTKTKAAPAKETKK